MGLKTKVPLTSDILAAISKAAEAEGNLSLFARKVGIHPSTLRMMVTTHPKGITAETWKLLYPGILPYIAGGVTQVPQRPMTQGDFSENLRLEAIPLNPERLRNVPVLTFAQAAGYEPALTPLCDYIRETSDKTRPFIDVPDTWFALEVLGGSMEPDYPDGSIALVAAGEFPIRGDIVVAKFTTGQVVMKEYHRKDNVITLLSKNENGKTFTWNIKEQPGYVQWMFPVVQILISPRAQRH